MNSLDHHFMQEAITEGEKGRLTAAPNPWVGAVIVRNEEIVGRGFHLRPGMPHAEPMALEEAGEKAQGATCYVTLEPCNFYGRTPPCTEALLKFGIKRVVVGVEDPDPNVAGQGIAFLRNKGLEVTVGVLAKEVEASLAPYLHHRRTQTPYTLLKIASSIDGKIAAMDHSSKWITGPDAREHVQALRMHSQAIAVGAKTAYYDNPSLTVRPLPEGFKAPWRCLFDAKGKTPLDHKIFDSSLAPTWMFTSKLCSPEHIKKLEKMSVKVSIISENQGMLALKEALLLLGKAGVCQLLVEGGGHLIGSFIEEGYAQKLIHFIAPKFLGDQGIPAFSGINVSTLSKSLLSSLEHSERFGEDTCLTYQLDGRKT